MAKGTQRNSKTKTGKQVKDFKCNQVPSRKVIDARLRRSDVGVGKTDLAHLTMVQDMVGGVTGEPINNIELRKVEPDIEVEVDQRRGEKPQLEEPELEKADVGAPEDIWFNLLLLAQVAEVELLQSKGEAVQSSDSFHNPESLCTGCGVDLQG